MVMQSQLLEVRAEETAAVDALRREFSVSAALLVLVHVDVNAVRACSHQHQHVHVLK